MSYIIIKVENDTIEPIVHINGTNDEHAKKYVIEYCNNYINLQNIGNINNNYFINTVQDINNMTDGYYIHHDLVKNSYNVYNKKTNYGYFYSTYTIEQIFYIIYKQVEETKILPKNNMNEVIYNELSIRLMSRRKGIMGQL